MELRSEKQREYQTDQRAGKAALGQPARIGPKAEPRRAHRSAQPLGGGSLVHLAKQGSAAPVYIPGCDSPHKLLSIAGSTLPNSRNLCPVGPTSSRDILHHRPASWPMHGRVPSRMQAVEYEFFCSCRRAIFFGILPLCIDLILKSHAKLYTCSLAFNTHIFLHI